MLKSELIKQLNDIEGDFEILFLTDWEVCQDDHGSWKSNSVEITKCIEAEFNDDMYMDEDALGEAVRDYVWEARLTEEEIDNECENLLAGIEKKEVIGIYLGV